jgi:hypothetical protein
MGFDPSCIHVVKAKRMSEPTKASLTIIPYGALVMGHSNETYISIGIIPVMHPTRIRDSRIEILILRA